MYAEHIEQLLALTTTKNFRVMHKRALRFARNAPVEEKHAVGMAMEGFAMLGLVLGAKGNETKQD